MTSRLQLSIVLSRDYLLTVLAREAVARLGLPSGEYYCEINAEIDDSKKIQSLTVTINKGREQVDK